MLRWTRVPRPQPRRVHIPAHTTQTRVSVLRPHTSHTETESSDRHTTLSHRGTPRGLRQGYRAAWLTSCHMRRGAESQAAPHAAPARNTTATHRPRTSNSGAAAKHSGHRHGSGPLSRAVSAHGAVAAAVACAHPTPTSRPWQSQTTRRHARQTHHSRPTPTHQSPMITVSHHTHSNVVDIRITQTQRAGTEVQVAGA
jgi:hypothetical protein